MNDIRFNYDSRFDILYIKISDKVNSYGDEDDSGLVIMKDIHTQEITGITIFDFMHKYKTNNLPKLPDSICIDFENIIDRMKY